MRNLTLGSLFWLATSSSLSAQTSIVSDPAEGEAPLVVNFAVANLPSGPESGPVVFEAESGASLDPREDEPGMQWQVGSGIAGASGGQYVFVPAGAARNGRWNRACEISWNVTPPSAGSYWLWLRRAAANSAENSAFCGVDGNRVGATVDNQLPGTWVWIRHSSPLSLSGGTQALQLRRREAGYAVDQILLTADAEFVPIGIVIAGDVEEAAPVFAWSFGDGTTSGLPEPQHVYENPGTYPVTVSVSGEAIDLVLETTIEIVAPNAAPTLNAGEDREIEVGSVNLEAEVADDGLPDGTLTLEWDTVTAPGLVAFADPSAASTQVTFEVAGEYELRLRASDGALESEDSLIIVVTNAPTPEPDPFPEPSGILVAMDAGGMGGTFGGVTFEADAGAGADSAGFTGGNFYANSIPVSGTEADPVYQALRWGAVAFQAPVPAGTYDVVLHYAEIYPPFGSGDRIFSVTIEGVVVEDDLDVFAEVGGASALVRTHTVSVTDGLLEIAWDGIENHPIISAVVVESATPAAPAEIVGISVSPPSATIAVGHTAPCVAWAHFSDGSVTDITADATWVPSSPILEPTGSPGTFHAVELGDAEIAVTWQGHSATASVFVIEVPEVAQALVFVRSTHQHIFDVIPRDRIYIEDEVHADIMKLEPIAPGGTVTNLTELPTGNGAVAFTPSVTPDGLHILFAMRSSYTEMYQIHRMATDGSGLVQLTVPPDGEAPADNISPVTIGGGRIAFLSNRGFRYDEYGKRNQYNLYTMNADGTDQRLFLDGLSGNYDVNCFADGTVAFTRWDYRPLMNKVAVDNYSLWRMNTDGSDLRPLWGLHYLTPRPGNHGIQDWRRVHCFPDGRLVTIGMGRTYTVHNYGSGFVAVLDPVTTLLDPYTNITPEVPENSDPSPAGRFLEAVPLGDDQLVTVYSDGPVAYGHATPDWNLHLMAADGSGRTPLLEESGMHLASPRVVGVRPEPPFVTSVVGEPPEEPIGVISCDDVFVANATEEIGSLHRPPFDATDDTLNPVEIRILEGTILQKTQFWNGTPKDTTFISDVKASLTYKILGEVPVHPDGSWAARIPAGRPVTFQALNASGQAIVSMPFWTMVAPGETKRCLGCHDPHDDSVVLAETNQSLEAPIPTLTGGSYLDFQDTISPTLAERCGSCHSGEEAAFGVDLSGDRTLFRDVTYRSLSKQRYGRFGLPSWMPFSYLASKTRGIGGVDSFLLALVTGRSVYGGTPEMQERLEELHPTHAALLTDDEVRQLARWTSLGTLFGTPVYRYIPDGEADEHVYPTPDLELWEAEVASMLVGRCGSCHSQYPSALPIPGFTVNTTHQARSANVHHQSVSGLLNRTGINANFDHPELSPVLRLGLGLDGHPAIFESVADPDYELLRTWIETGTPASN